MPRRGSCILVAFLRVVVDHVTLACVNLARALPKLTVLFRNHSPASRLFAELLLRVRGIVLDLELFASFAAGERPTPIADRRLSGSTACTITVQQCNASDYFHGGR